MSVFDRLRSTDVSSTTAGLSIGALLILCVGVVFIVRTIAGSPPAPVEIAKPRAAPHAPVVDVSEVAPTRRGAAGNARTSGSGIVGREHSTTAGQPVEIPDKERYSVITERDLFRPLGQRGANSSAGSAGAQSEGGVPPMPVPSMGKLPQLPGVTVVPVDDEFKKSIAFTGAFGTPSGMTAILENVSTKETMMVKKGESAFGCTVANIDPKSVSLQKDGQTFTLAIGENKVPETSGSSKKGSDQKQPQQQNGKPGQNGQPGQPPKPGQNGQPAPPEVKVQPNHH